MNSLQYTDTVDSFAVLDFAHSKAEDAAIGDASALYKPYPLEFRQASKLCHTAVGQSGAAREVNVTDAVACLGQSLDTDVSDTGTVAKVNVVKVLAKLGNGEDSSVSDHPALC
jgi:hypothetical protein